MQSDRDLAYTALLEAAQAWEVCASLHRQYAKGRDAVFKARQADYMSHAQECRDKANKIRSDVAASLSESVCVDAQNLDATLLATQNQTEKVINNALAPMPSVIQPSKFYMPLVYNKKHKF